MLNLSASPFSLGKEAIRHRLAVNCVRRHGVPFVYVNQVGANDELVFDGGSFVLDRQGRILTQLPAFEEAVVTVDLNGEGTAHPLPAPDPAIQVREALVLGIRDYLGKCGFRRPVIGPSGGIDSALPCALAAQALGTSSAYPCRRPTPPKAAWRIRESWHAT